MGGETITPTSFTSEDEEESSVDQDFPHPSLSSPKPTFVRDGLGMKVEDRKDKSGNLFVEEFDQVFPQFSSSLNSGAYNNQRQKLYKEVLQSYDHLRVRTRSLNEAKSKVLSYIPGAWIENVGGMKFSDYDAPETTSLLLVGPKGSGKSSLVNRISRVFEDDKFAPERAQVSYSSSAEDGTYYLQEYKIPRCSSSFCLYDTRGLSDESSDNIKMINHWMKNGVRHGELVVRKPDDSRLRRRMKCKIRVQGRQFCKTRTVNFVIFVVNAVTALKSMEHDGQEECGKPTSIDAFNCPFLAFKDDKPVLVITHGDLLSIADRVHVRVLLGEMLGISPAKQIFDIPDIDDPITELTIVYMLRYALEHADRNLPHKDWVMEKVRKVSISACKYLLVILGIAFVAALMVRCRMTMKHARLSKLDIDWHAIRHMWLDD